MISSLRKLKYLLLLFFCGSLAVNAQTQQDKDDLVKWVNPLVGSDSDYKLSTGNTYPAI